MAKDIGKLESVPLRELWKHEEHGFSAWLENNIEVLAETLDLRLSVVEREKTAGAFEVDLLAEDDKGNPVIIENQLEPTNHDHLGKILTYLTNLDAKIAIWIASDPRPEHIRAVSWLNEATPADVAFYLVRMAAYRIAGSAPAPLFTLIVSPTPESKDIGQKKKDLAVRHVLRLKFWTQLLERAKAVTPLHGARSPSKEHWISAGAGKAGLSFNYVIWEDKGAAELYIDTGDAVENKRIFDYIQGHKEKVERDFGSSLLWERLDEKRASRIRFCAANGGIKSEEAQWPAIQETMIDAMVRLSKALKPHIQSYRSQAD